MSIVGTENSTAGNNFLTFAEVVAICTQYPNKYFRFEDTEYYPLSIKSWRGSYCLPSMDYSCTPVNGKDLSELILKEIDEVHEAWKGGEYTYDLDDEFYISEFGRCEEHKIVGYRNVGHEIILLTELDPY